jgi:antibiotic biosynthesis monooxygenase (ABM) superfamily enzyme
MLVMRKRDDMQQSAETGTQAVTVCISVQARQGRERDLENWLEEVGRAASQFAGHQGLTVLQPAGSGSAEYVYIFRFDTYAHLKQWEDSEERRLWVGRLNKLTEGKARKQVLTGLEYWFTLPDAATMPPPPRYKMVIVTLLAIYPLSTLLSSLLTPSLGFLPFLVRGLPVSIVLVLLMTYVVMPVMTRLFARWLFPVKRKTAQPKENTTERILP